MPSASPLSGSPRFKALHVMKDDWVRLVYPVSFDAELTPFVDFVAPPQTAETVAANPGLLAEVEVIFSGWGMISLEPALLAAAPRLRAVFYAAGSVRYFTTPDAWARDLVICTANELNAIPVADYTLGAILFGLRRGWYYANAVRRSPDLWYQRNLPGTYGSTVALISLGAIGRLVRERLRPFDVEVIAYDPFCPREQAIALGVELVSLEEAFARADAVSLHTPLLPETRGMIRREHFAALRNGATFINTARGPVIREEELIEVLRTRPDLQAVLDVADSEPPAADNPLRELPNVVLTPHIAGTGDREAARLGRAMVDEFHRWRQGQPLRHRVTAEQAARMA